MSGDFLALLAAVLHVLLKRNPELIQEIKEMTDYYRRYIFPEGADIKVTMDQAFDLLTSITDKETYNYSDAETK